MYFLALCLRPLRRHCIPVRKRRTLSAAWNPIWYGDSRAAVFSCPRLPSDSWNKLTWKVNQTPFKDRPASPWRFCHWLPSLPQTPVGECPWATFAHFIFWKVIGFCGLLRFCGSLFDLCRSKVEILELKEKRVIFLRYHHYLCRSRCFS